MSCTTKEEREARFRAAVKAITDGYEHFTTLLGEFDEAACLVEESSDYEVDVSWELEKARERFVECGLWVTLIADRLEKTK